MEQLGPGLPKIICSCIRTSVYWCVVVKIYSWKLKLKSQGCWDYDEELLVKVITSFCHAVWNKSAGVNFSIQTAQAYRANAIFSLWKVHECWYIPNCLRKIMWLLVNDIQANITLTESLHQSQNLHLGSPQRWLSPKRIGKFRYSLTQRN